MQTTRFDPAQSDPRAFRDALGRFATGITVITCATPTGPIGITANSFASVSLDPALVLWSPAKNSSRYPFFMAAEHFAIHVIADDQQGICQGFARAGDAFGGIDWKTSPRGVPLINHCLSRFECKTHATHDGGDHSIVVGQVIEVETRTGAPLMFFGGQYGAFDPL
ncbi:MAG: flavin reductase family protein [Pelagimonas sp.]|uniref:flavin reductase family protein n=1 Tax=Pelagimonas sp. TaxID=2073170 RepID=UPI003D6A7C54